MYWTPRTCLFEISDGGGGWAPGHRQAHRGGDLITRRGVKHNRSNCDMSACVWFELLFQCHLTVKSLTPYWQVFISYAGLPLPNTPSFYPVYVFIATDHLSLELAVRRRVCADGEGGQTQWDASSRIKYHRMRVLCGLRWSFLLVYRMYFLGQVWLFSSFSSFKARRPGLIVLATGADSSRESKASCWQGYRSGWTPRWPRRNPAFTLDTFYLLSIEGSSLSLPLSFGSCCSILALVQQH